MLLFVSIILIGYNWRSHPQTILIAGVFIIYSLYSLLYYFTLEEKNDFWYAVMFGNLTPLWYLPGPFLYFYYRSTLCNSPIFTSWKDSLHFLPSTVQFLTMIPYYIIPFSEKLRLSHAIHENPDLIQQTAKQFTLYSVNLDFASRPLSMAIYLLACYYLIRKFSDSSHNHRYTLRWLNAFLLLLSLETIIYSASIILLIKKSFDFTYEVVHQMHNLTGGALFVLPIILLCFFPQILYGNLKTKPVSTKTSTTQTSDSSFVQLSERINTYIQDEKMYLNPDLEISDISFALKIPRHHIAYCFTNVMQSKFTNYKNKLRVEHAKKLLENGEYRLNSIDGIGTKSGFKSRSAFYEAFKAETGMTPNQYIKEVLGNRNL